VDWRLIILGILRRVFLAILFIIVAIYAFAAFGGALCALMDAVIYTKCLFSNWFDIDRAGIMFNILTSDFSNPRQVSGTSAFIIGLPTGIWGAWQALSKGVNPFKYMWERE
jgi:hypothetical protein